MKKERPILFSAPMVRAILDGSKTQTRRIVKPQPSNGWKLICPGLCDQKPVLGEITSKHPKRGRFGVFTVKQHDGFTERDLIVCPYGQPGDRLWVRESTEEDCAGSVSLSRYRADGAFVLYSGCDDPAFNGSIAHWNYPRRVRPSIHMPRWASRILLEIVSVRVERLQEISEADAKAEGTFGPEPAVVGGEDCEIGFPSHVQEFRHLWKSINGAGSWDENPWVWVVEFKPINA